MQLFRSRTYHTDLENIVDYIAHENPVAALKLWNEIEENVEHLRVYPHSGRLGRIEGTREFVIAQTPYIVIYSVEQIVVMLRILHGAQQWPKNSI